MLKDTPSGVGQPDLEPDSFVVGFEEDLLCQIAAYQALHGAWVSCQLGRCGALGTYFS